MLTVFVLILIPCIWAQNNNSFYYGSSQVYSSEATQMGRDMNAIREEYGNSSALVLMVPTGDSKSEAKLGKELEDIERVTSVISYANTVGTMIPEEMIPEDLVSQLYSEDYSRYVVMVNMGEESKGWDKKVDEIRKTGEKYYGKETLLAGDLASTEDLKTTITQDMTWVNILAVPYFQHTTLHYIAYLIISSVQLGATIDYAILFTDRYLGKRKQSSRKQAAWETVKDCTISIFTSASILTIAGTILGIVSTNLVLSQLGTLVGRGTTISFILVIFVLPTLLMLFDKCIEKTTWHASFYKEEKKKKLLIA